MDFTLEEYLAVVDKAINIVLAKGEVEEGDWTAWATAFVNGERTLPPEGVPLEKAPPKYGIGIGVDEDAQMINEAVNTFANCVKVAGRARWDSYFVPELRVGVANLLDDYNKLLKFVGEG